MYSLRRRPDRMTDSSSSDGSTGESKGSSGLAPQEPGHSGRRYDEAEDRERLTAGEIDVDDLQRLADELQQEINERQYRRRR